MRMLIISFIFLTLTSCASYTLVGGAPISVKGMKFQAKSQWNKAPNAPGKNVEVWTADGHQLNELILIGQIESGETLFKPANKELPMPSFKAGMLPNEMENLVATSLKNLLGGEIDIKTSNLRPMPLEDKMGFRFNLDFYTQGGLAKRGDVLIIEKDEKLYGMVLIATKIHYFDALAGEFEAMAQSVRI